MRFRAGRLVCIAVVALALCGVQVTLAEAAPAAVSTVYDSEDFFGGYNASEFQYGGVGTPRVALGTATTTVAVAFRFEEYDFTFCEITATETAAVVNTVVWGPGQDTEPDRVPVTPGSIEAGVEYDLTCENGYYNENQTTWHLVGRAGGAATLSLDETGRRPTRTVMSNFAFPGDSSDQQPIPPVAEGERIRIAPYTDFWQVEGVAAPIEATISADYSPSPGAAIRQPLVDPKVAGDGDSLDVSVPSDLTDDYATPVLRIRRTGVVAATATSPEQVMIKQATFQTQLVTKIRTKTSLSLNARSVATQRATATVTVSTVDGSSPVGDLVIVADERAEIARVTLDGSEHGRVALKLPRLSRGQHALTASFRNSIGQRGSVSPTRPLRQLI